MSGGGDGVVWADNGGGGVWRGGGNQSENNERAEGRKGILGGNQQVWQKKCEDFINPVIKTQILPLKG